MLEICAWFIRYRLKWFLSNAYTHLKVVPNVYVCICMHSKTSHTQICHVQAHSSGTQTHSKDIFHPWMFLSVGRNMIFHNKEVTVYCFLAILWQELDISCFLLPCSNYSLCAEGTSKAMFPNSQKACVISWWHTHTAWCDISSWYR